MIRIYIVEDHPVMQATLVDYLGMQDNFDLCGIASTAEDALAGLANAEPSLVLLDLSLPGRSGFDLLGEICKRWQLPCIILSGHREKSYVGRAFAAGARGYILKGTPNEIPIGIERVMRGEIFLSDSLRQALDYSGSEVGA